MPLFPPKIAVSIQEKKVLPTSMPEEGGKTGSPASGSAADTHSNVNTVLVKGPSAAPSESQSRSPFYLCYLSVTFLNLRISGLCLAAVNLLPRSH